MRKFRDTAVVAAVPLNTLWLKRNHSMSQSVVSKSRQPRQCTRCQAEFISNSQNRKYCDNCTHSRPLEERFWSNVLKTDSCWLWTAGLDNHGYGYSMTPNKQSGKAHRVAWELTNGEIPAGLGVLHRRDNPRCVNPDHLFLGTQADNMHDMWRKGRGADRRGENQGRHVLTEDQAREVLRRALTGEDQSLIASEFGVHRVTVCSIKNRRTWKHLDISSPQYGAQ